MRGLNEIFAVMGC